jgi:hypothetical protein
MSVSDATIIDTIMIVIGDYGCVKYDTVINYNYSIVMTLFVASL